MLARNIGDYVPLSAPETEHHNWPFAGMPR